MQLLWSLVLYFTVAAALEIASEIEISTIQSEKNIKTDSEERNVKQVLCRTNYCHEIASRILNNRNTSVNPCDDFYEYACGSWKSNHPIPKSELEWSEDLQIQEKTLLRIRDVLEDRSQDMMDIAPVRMVKQLYRSCMNTDNIERWGITPIRNILDSTGGIPIAMPRDEWTARNISWQEIDQKYITLMGSSAFFNLEYEVDENNTSRYILKIDPYVESSLNLLVKRKTESNTDYDGAYIYGINRIIEMFTKHKLEKTQLLKDIVDLLQFALKVEKITQKEKGIDAERKRRRMTIEELQNWYDSIATEPTAKINFLGSIQELFKIANVNVHASEPIVIYNRVFLRRLAELLGQTPQHVIVNYIQWNALNEFLPYTTDKLRIIKANMFLLKYNASAIEPRWKTCVNGMEMKDAVSYLFVKKYFSHLALDDVVRMVDGIQAELKKRIVQSKWVSDTMKTSLIEKLGNLKKQIGYPDWYGNATALSQRYQGLTIGWNYFQNIVNCKKYELKRTILEFKEAPTRDEWSDYPITLNAFYTEKTNAMVIPAAELQDPYFTSLMPEAVNYGAVGFVIGHELSHCFDNDGIQHDAQGRIVSWSSEEMMNEYQERVTCLKNQYNNYTVKLDSDQEEPIQLDGDLTKNENMADSTGLKLAYGAFSKTIKTSLFRTVLPGLENVPDEQLFFLSFANTWCTSIRPAYMKDAINTDEHSPPNIRVIGAVSNSKAFAKAFKCPPRSPMNPENKCRLWK